MESSSSTEASRTRAAASVGARSYLFVPANRPERIAKARESGADAIIVDLEDAVAPEAKAAARAALPEFLDPARPVIVRINAATTRWFTEDLQLCQLPGVGGVMLPKAEDAGVLRDLAGTLTRTQGNAIALLPLVETARGLWNALDLAQSPGVRRLAFGQLDFQVDLDLSGDDEALAPFRAQLVLVSRVAGILAPIDGPTTAIDDAQTIRADALRARRAGFGAKLCIHPKQVGLVNEAFGPSPDEVAWAKRVIAAAQAAQGAAVAADGQMIDQPVLARAELILKAAGEGSSTEMALRASRR